jgi:ribosomal protein S4E
MVRTVTVPNAWRLEMQVTTYTLKTSNGRHVRTATKVVLTDGREIKFMERMSKREALRAVAAMREP